MHLSFCTFMDSFYENLSKIFVFTSPFSEFIKEADICYRLEAFMGGLSEIDEAGLIIELK